MLSDEFLAILTPRPGTLDAPWAFAFQGTQLVVAENGAELTLPTAAQLMQSGMSLEHAHCIGEWKDRACVAVEVPSDWKIPDGWRVSGLRSAYGRMDEALFWIAGRALQILEWDRTHRFCGRCGTPTKLKPGERARVCPACDLHAYPRISPAMMVLIKRGREVLLARAKHFPPGIYSALAGFVEPGESLEQTVIREVREEVGVEIEGLRYFGSQPWPFPHSLMLAFVADYAGGEVKPDGIEIEAATWFDVDQLPTLPFKASIAHRLISTIAAELR